MDKNFYDELDVKVNGTFLGTFYSVYSVIYNSDGLRLSNLLLYDSENKIVFVCSSDSNITISDSVVNLFRRL